MLFEFASARDASTQSPCELGSGAELYTHQEPAFSEPFGGSSNVEGLSEKDAPGKEPYRHESLPWQVFPCCLNINLVKRYY